MLSRPHPVRRKPLKSSWLTVVAGVLKERGITSWENRGGRGGGYLPVKFISKPYPLAPHIYAAIDRVERTEKLHSMIRYDVVMIREIWFD